MSDCKGLTQSLTEDKWQLRASETTKVSAGEISMLRSCFEKGNEFYLNVIKPLNRRYKAIFLDVNNCSTNI